VHTTGSVNVKCTFERCARYRPDDLHTVIESCSWQQEKPGEFLTVRPMNWDEILDKDDDTANWADPGPPSDGWGRLSHLIDNDNGNG
jgi:hypothetical protein